jgi:hypothetical protein
MEKSQYDCIISINIHENFNFLVKQLDDIKNNVAVRYAVVLNCNEHMFNECKSRELPENIYICDKPLNKRLFDGSLTEGIYNNMVYSVERFQFDFFIVASSRNFFFFFMTMTDLNKLVERGVPYYLDDRPWSIKKFDWHWPIFEKTQLVKHCLENDKKFYASSHEGLVFTGLGCEKIIEFLSNHTDIRDDLFHNSLSCVEEFSLQTISMYMGENFYYIGNGIHEDPIVENDPESDIMKFMYKVKRE